MLFAAVWYGGKSELIMVNTSDKKFGSKEYIELCQPVIRRIMDQNPHLDGVIEDGAPIHTYECRSCPLCVTVWVLIHTHIHVYHRHRP